MITIKKLESYWHVRGKGPCNWAQPPTWPCSETVLRSHAFPEASERFIRECIEKYKGTEAFADSLEDLKMDDLLPFDSFYKNNRNIQEDL